MNPHFFTAPFCMSLLAMIFFNKGLAFLRKVMYYRKVS